MVKTVYVCSMCNRSSCHQKLRKCDNREYGYPKLVSVYTLMPLKLEDPSYWNNEGAGRMDIREFNCYNS